MTSKGYESMWCPLARISIQKRQGNNFMEILSSGAFNTVYEIVDGEQKIRWDVSACKGEKCPLFKKSILPWRSGKCSLGNHAVGVCLFWAAVFSLSVFGLLLLIVRSLYGVY